MSLDGREREERLHRLDAAGTVAVVDDGLTLSNGLGSSPDGRTLFHVDSIPGIVWSRSYDTASGAIGPRRAHLRIEDGTPDGLFVDTDGNLLIAIRGAGQVRCYDGGGVQIATVEVAAPHTSSVACVGPARDRLLITSATKGALRRRPRGVPFSGHLFLADVGRAEFPRTRGRATVH